MGVAHKVRHVKEREEVKAAFCSHEKMIKVLNFTANYTLPEGLGRMAQWAKKQGSRKSKRFKDIEIRKNLPPVWLE
jgi:UDP-glucose 4-epimerase